MAGTEPLIVRHLHAKGTKLGLPVGGNFELTPRCNFNCKMCYVHLTKEQQEAAGKELTADEWLSVAETAVKRGMIFLLLTGGEPLLRPDFREIYLGLRKMGLFLSINTNGYLIDEDTVRLFKEETPFRLNISLYGSSNETYERLCGVPAYDRIIGNIRRLREGGINVKLNLSLTPFNEGDKESILNTARELGVRVEAVSYMFPPVRRSCDDANADARFTPERAAACITDYDRLWLTDEQLLQRLDNWDRGIREISEAECGELPGSKLSCHAGRSAFWLTWDGRMLPCGMLTTPSVSVRELGFDAAWEQIKEKTDGIIMPSACANCENRHICTVCAASSSAETGRFDGKPEYLCRMTEERLRLTREMCRKMKEEQA